MFSLSLYNTLFCGKNVDPGIHADANLKTETSALQIENHWTAWETGKTA